MNKKKKKVAVCVCVCRSLWLGAMIIIEGRNKKKMKQQTQKKKKNCCSITLFEVVVVGGGRTTRVYSASSFLLMMELYRQNRYIMGLFFRLSIYLSTATHRISWETICRGYAVLAFLYTTVQRCSHQNMMYNNRWHHGTNSSLLFIFTRLTGFLYSSSFLHHHITISLRSSVY